MGFREWIRGLWTTKSCSDDSPVAVDDKDTDAPLGMSHEGAQRFLKSCDLVQIVIMADMNDDGLEIRHSYWNDTRKDRVAYGRLHGTSDEVWVQGSYFTGDAARVLRGCFKSADRRIERKTSL